MHQPWRTFVAVINRCVFGKSTGLDRLRESRAQILWAMYNQKNVDYVALLWEDFMYQADNRETSSARKEHMPYPRFTKVIIDHFISKDNTISMRNMINLHTEIPSKKERKFKKPASFKLKTVPASPKEPTQKGKRVKRPAKKATTVPTTDVIIRDTPDNENESNDVNDEDDDNDDNGDDDNSDDNDDGGNEDDYKENPSFTLPDYEEEEQDEEYIYTQEKDKSNDEEKIFEKEDDDVDEMIKTRMKTPPMDQTEGRKEESQARMLNHQKAQSQKNQSHPALPKAPNISINLLISTIAKECYKERQPPCTFDELIGTPIDFSAFVMNRLKIDNLTQEILARPSFNLLKGTCKSFVELEYHFEECYKAINDRLDWHNLKGRKYLFDLSKPLPLIEVQRRQVVPANYFINNDLKYLKEEIVIRRDDNVLYKFKECDFPKPNLRDIKDLLLLLVQKKLSNLDVDDRYSLGVALRMFTRCIVILHRVKDLPLRVESYQKQLNITRPETFRSDIPNMIPYNGYTNP
nr:hypothetical protein [Tanacetum cinerariifolium]